MINKVTLIGNVGADPEVRSLEGGVKTARIRIATTERIYNRQTQESREHTEWHTITLWRGLAEFADRYVRKGSQVYVEGRIRSREWEDQAGVKRYGIEILADELRLLGRKPEGAGAPAASTPSATDTYSAPASAAPSASMPAAQPEPQIDSPVSDPDDLPF